MKMTNATPDISAERLSGRNRRLLHEWEAMERAFCNRGDISYAVHRKNVEGLPTAYLVTYRMRSICGVEREAMLGNPGTENPPRFACQFYLEISLPPNYPCVDAAARYSFLVTSPDGAEIPHPWHPNIRYFGAFAGRVCLNQPDTYAPIPWAVCRIAEYLRYERYHARLEPPYPEDLVVARWVREQGEPKGWIYFGNEIGLSPKCYF